MDHEIMFSKILKSIEDCGGDAMELAEILKQSPNKSSYHCRLYHKITKGDDTNYSCPWPEQCVHNPKYHQ